MSDSASPLTSALEQLRLKLLDLTGRNRLINFKHTAGKSLQFVEGHPAAIYQKLVEANNKANISVLGLPEPARRDWVERNGRLQRPEPRDWAKSVGVSTGYDISGAEEDSEESNVRALMYPDDLAKHCRKIEREATLAIEDVASNTAISNRISLTRRSGIFCLGGAYEVRIDYTTYSTVSIAFSTHICLTATTDISKATITAISEIQARCNLHSCLGKLQCLVQIVNLALLSEKL